VHKDAAKFFDGILFTPDQLPLFKSILDIEKQDKNKNNLKVLEVFKVIFNESPKTSNPSAPGVTKEYLYEKLNASRKVMDDIISLLQGATLIQYRDDHRYIYWTCTPRGVQMANYLRGK